jgi:hypothetical protein
MIKSSNISLRVVISKELNETLKQLATIKNTSVSKLCKEYILTGMKKDLKQYKDLI